MDSFDEVERAAGHYYHSEQQLGIDNRTKALVMDRLLGFLKGPNVLELGFVDGEFTDRLLQTGAQVDVVEGAVRHVAFGEKKYGDEPRVRFFHALFQDFQPEKTYDTVVAGDMIRYIVDPVSFLRKVSGWLKADGRLLITVPNSRSLHRRVGSLMGLEAGPEEANSRDKEVGNQRSYDRYQLWELLRSSGFRVTELRGAFLKPLSSAQMKDWSDELLGAFNLIGQELEDYCWFLYAVASPEASLGTRHVDSDARRHS